MADFPKPDSYYDLSDIFPPATINDPSKTASAAGSIERPSAYEPVVIACCMFDMSTLSASFFQRDLKKKEEV